MMFRAGRSLALMVMGVAFLPAQAFAQGTTTGTSAASGSKTSTAAQIPAASQAEVARLYAQAARTYYKAGKYAEALGEFQKAYAIAPTPSLLYNMARCHERLSQWKEALELYTRYRDQAPSAQDKADAQEKIDLLTKKVGVDTDSPEAQYKARINAGRKAYSAGQYEEAIEQFKAAFDIKATTGALFNIAKSYEKMARNEEAIDYYQQYIDLDPNAGDRKNIEENIARLKRLIKARYQELSVNSDPPGAEIYMDDRNAGLQGQTNSRFKVTPGPHTLYLDLNGYEPIKKEFNMPDDKPLQLDFKLKKLVNVGELQINVDQPGARIFIDGAIVGLSPYTQKKKLKSGKHQVTVELAGYNRWTGDVAIIKDQLATVNAQLEKYVAPVSDDTLSSWGRNLLLIGLIGGGLGVAGPFAYQKLFVRRDYYKELGPERADGSVFYQGPLDGADPNRRGNSELNILRIVQLSALIAGGATTIAGLTVYMYKWFRTVPPQPVTSSLDTEDDPVVTIEGFGMSPTQNGASFGLMGSF